jgi:hypothetical protein
MAYVDKAYTCRYCGFKGAGNYCGQCGKRFTEKRITLQNLLHDVFHLFTHLDKGFGYTLKQLIVAPGSMQRSYVEGDRGRHQKPFSMFFICATVAGLARYWMFRVLLQYYNAGNSSEVTFFHEYMVLLQIALLPLYALITYLFFLDTRFNFAEMGVLMLYSVSFLLLVSIFVSLLKFIWPSLDTAYVELPILVVYYTLTCIQFFREQPRWKVVLKSVVLVIIIFLLVQVAEDLIIKGIS